jgi:hypothetical protein
MDAKSPFSLQRFEYGRKHIFFLQEDTFLQLENAQPAYIIGSRGTGKTTLLNALNWKERLFNESLRSSIGDNSLFKYRYIGIYIRTSDFNVDSFEIWLQSENTDVRGPIFAFYIDLIWIESLAIALSELVLTEHLKLDPQQEHTLIENILCELPELGKYQSQPKEYTFRELSRSIKKIRQNIETMSKKRSDPKKLLDDFQIGHFGDYGRHIGSSITNFLDTLTSPEAPYWHIKVCFDEAECLSDFQRLVLNTCVRLSKSHIFYVISYVDSLVDVTRTLIPKITLQDADRTLINLDKMSDDAFIRLAEGVSNVRIKKIIHECPTFKVTELLGRLDINTLLSEILTMSESAAAKELLNEGKKLAGQPFFQLTSDEDCDYEDMLHEASFPYYQAYIIKALNLVVPDPAEPRWKRRAQDSREIRKKMVAAYLCICHELNTDVRYAFSEMVLQMSDKCIRDFLRQIDFIFAESGLELKDFIESKISLSKQHEGIKKSSQAKKESISRSGIAAPLEISRIIDGLARITAIIQSRPKDKALRSSERGVFVVSVKDGELREYANTFALIQEACEAGFLKMIDSTRRKWQFRVHTSLAANYGFSYRGAYYDTHVSIRDIDALRVTKDPDDFNKIVSQLAKRFSGEGEHPLFDGVTE